MKHSKINEDRSNVVKIVEISNSQAGQRLDNYLLTRLKGVPKSHVYRLLRSGQVRVNKGRKKPHYRLEAGDTVRIPPVATAVRAQKTVPDAVLKVLKNARLFENGDILVLNKPAGIAVHGGSEIDFGIIEALRRIYPDQFVELVHRLDRETSGCLVLAKNRMTLTRLHQALRKEGNATATEGVRKTYLALLAGVWQEGEQTVDLPMRKFRRSGEHRVEISADGAAAISHFKLVQHYHGASLMQVRIDTGRTHQIRVHAAATGHPVAGDKKYGDAVFNREMKRMGLQRLFLHASHIELPIGEGLSVHAPLTDDLSKLLDKIAS
ncbi:MAG: RluA family pseudouridine synthase [Gammaproteobacteria bacterium]|jgi:23S rRNA pseudouridine955/2504/2580 synthase